MEEAQERLERRKSLLPAGQKKLDYFLDVKNEEDD